jgi:hypothetical protein
MSWIPYMDTPDSFPKQNQKIIQIKVWRYIPESEHLKGLMWCIIHIRVDGGTPTDEFMKL